MALKDAKSTHFLTEEYKVIDPRFGGDYKRVELDLGCGKGGFSLKSPREILIRSFWLQI